MLTVLFLTGLVGHIANAQEVARISHPATLDALAGMFRKAHGAGDAQAVRALGASVCPTSSELRATLRVGEQTTSFLTAYRGPVDCDLAQADQAAGLLALGRALFASSSQDQTKVTVYAATTEQIATYAPGSLAFAEFPGGMRRFAGRVAAPERQWFVVGVTNPDEPDGMKYSCFTRVEEHFIVVIKPWRAIPSD